MTYYAEKQKDATKQAVYWFWLVIITIGVATWYYAFKGFVHKCPEPAKPLLIERVIEIQEEVGARPDGVIGPESTGLINAKTKEELPEYCNRQAIASMNRMAGKE